MDAPVTAELDESRITGESRRFAADLFARFPELRQHAAMERQQDHDTWTLVVTVPAPSWSSGLMGATTPVRGSEVGTRTRMYGVPAPRKELSEGRCST